MKQNTDAGAKNESAKILSILESGHEVTMWHCDDEFTREEANPGEPIKIHLRAATESDDTRHMAVKYLTRDGEVIMSEGIGQPGIDSLTKNRSWTVDKQ